MYKCQCVLNVGYLGSNLFSHRLYSVCWLFGCLYLWTEIIIYVLIAIRLSLGAPIDHCYLFCFTKHNLVPLLFILYPSISVDILSGSIRNINNCLTFEYKKLKTYEQTFLFLKVQIWRFTKQKRSNIDTIWFRILNYNIIFWSTAIPKLYIS